MNIEDMSNLHLSEIQARHNDLVVKEYRSDDTAAFQTYLLTDAKPQEIDGQDWYIELGSHETKSGNAVIFEFE